MPLKITGREDIVPLADAVVKSLNDIVSRLKGVDIPLTEINAWKCFASQWWQAQRELL